MDKDQILEALNGLGDFGGVVDADQGDVVVQKKADGTWRMNSGMGYLEYTTEELAEELAGWDEKIYSIR